MKKIHQIWLDLFTCIGIAFIFVVSLFIVSAGLSNSIDTWFNNPANQFTIVICLSLAALTFGFIRALKFIKRKL